MPRTDITARQSPVWPTSTLTPFGGSASDSSAAVAAVAAVEAVDVTGIDAGTTTEAARAVESTCLNTAKAAATEPV